MTSNATSVYAVLLHSLPSWVLYSTTRCAWPTMSKHILLIYIKHELSEQFRKRLITRSTSCSDFSFPETSVSMLAPSLAATPLLLIGASKGHPNPDVGVNTRRVRSRELPIPVTLYYLWSSHGRRAKAGVSPSEERCQRSSH